MLIECKQPVQRADDSQWSSTGLMNSLQEYFQFGLDKGMPLQFTNEFIYFLFTWFTDTNKCMTKKEESIVLNWEKEKKKERERTPTGITHRYMTLFEDSPWFLNWWCEFLLWSSCTVACHFLFVICQKPIPPRPGGIRDRIC